jgi:hypothetical protein
LWFNTFNKKWDINVKSNLIWHPSYPVDPSEKKLKVFFDSGSIDFGCPTIRRHNNSQ